MTEQQFTVIIMNDRISVQPAKMIESMRLQDDFNLVGVGKDVGQISELVSGKTIDIIIFAGYQENEDNYSVVELLSTPGHKPIVVIWAILDAFISFVCNEHKIRFQFDRQQPVADFFDYLRIVVRNHLNA